MAKGDGDKRTVATDALETLGTIIDNNQKRDAIHLAVEPVEAGMNLKRGDHITIVNGLAIKTEEGEGLGIVDPFLPSSGVKRGQKFWFVMYPRMVHSLRHVWTHPSFPDEVGTTRKPTKEESEKWLRDFCERVDCPGYDAVMEAISEDNSSWGSSEYGGSYSSDYLTFYGSDAHGEIPAEFWAHAENVLGRTLDKRPAHFSCSC